MPILSTDLQRTLGEAFAAHEAGRIPEAERLYKAVLDTAPDQFDALQLLGLLKAQSGHRAEAERLLRRALAINADSADLHFNLGNVLNELGRIEEALAFYDAALARHNGFAEAAIYRAVILNQLGRAEDALRGLDALLAKGPNAEAFYNRANVLKGQGRTEEAIDDYDRALAQHPGFSEAWFNRANTLYELGRADEAIASYDRALAAAPDNPDALNNRGVALLGLGRADEALAAFEQVIAAVPDFADAHYNRGNALRHLNRLDEALASYDRALVLNPAYPAAANNRGNVLVAMKRPNDAIASFDRAIADRPDYAEARYNRGQALIEAARYEAAITDFDWLLRHETPDTARWCKGLRGDRLYAQMQCCDWSDLERASAEIVAGVRSGAAVCDPFNFLAISDSPADQLQCATIHAAAKFPAVSPLSNGSGRAHDRIRLGYVSGEFREQATAFLLVELIERHDKTRFEVFGFDNGFDDGGPTRARLNAAFDRLVDISAMTDDEAARAIDAAGIDILINLNGYFGYGRNGVFARRPAPIQVNYLGFPGTLGADYIDYIVADRWTIPEADRRHYREKVATLPDSYQPNDSRRRIADATPTRGDVGLPKDAFVFCSFNNNYKLTPAMFDRWMRILLAVNGSVLWLLEGNDAVVRNLHREARARGVSPERLVFAPRIPPDRHLPRQRLADLCLDTLPYNAHTTASDALWAGLPVLTCAGTAFAGRVAASLLSAVDLPELIAASLDDYERRAIQLAREPARLAEIKAKLAQNLKTAALFDSERYRRYIEAAFETMVRRHRAGERPESFSVE
jgi:protein O-GlcNAc transferase